MMADNTAVYLTATKAPLQVKPAPKPVPRDNELVIKTRAVAINPVDWAVQEYGPDVFKFITLPHIPGYDIAGEVTAVGAAVTKFKVGDRVAGLSQSGGQKYAPLTEHLTTHIPNALTWAQGAVLPMGTMVGIKALFHKDYLALDLPVSGPKPPVSKGQTVFIGGGATSVGSCTIQLAVAAGYDVISTASPHNFAYVKSKLGASQVLDYHSPTITEDLVAAFRGKTCAGAVANGGFGSLDGSGPASVETCAAVVASCPGGKQFVAMTMAPTWGPSFEGVEVKFVEELKDDVELASAVCHGYLADALAEGSFVPLPEPDIVGEGLEAIQGAIDTLRKGVSKKKIVVTL